MARGLPAETEAEADDERVPEAEEGARVDGSPSPAVCPEPLSHAAVQAPVVASAVPAVSSVRRFMAASRPT